MPCFQGLAVSIHTPDGPLPEYSIQKNSRAHRITSYIPVPPAKVPPGASKPEQSTFAISITLLTPGLNVPYSTPKPGPDDPYPRPKVVGGLPGYGNERGKYGPVIGPYIPLTSSPNETIAAYIYFDGRAKEEVATLLRRGEETWVNSRWVSVPESEGGGLAEREFLFREVGLERWLNGLDLEGKDKDVAARIERRRQRLEKKRRKKREQKGSDDDDDDDDMETDRTKTTNRNGVLRYGEDKTVEPLSGDEGLFTSDSDSDDEPPMPEAAGQIKVALFRVLASGEIKRGEYSPQFDAHDDDDTTGANGDPANDADVDHTTSFAKPKTLDPKSISTQTVTGIDPPDKPYAVFTFLYRGEKQLRKMGILPTPSAAPKTPAATKRKTGLDFSALKPLTTTGTRNFAGYRDPNASPTKKTRSGKAKDVDDMDSDAEDDDDARIGTNDDDIDIKVEGKGMLSAEDVARQEEMAEGVRKIKLKRAHSADPVQDSPTKSPADFTPSGSASAALSPGSEVPTSAAAALAAKEVAPEAAVVGSPFKKQRASLPGFDEGVRSNLGSALANASSSSVLGGAPLLQPRSMSDSNASGQTASAAGSSVGVGSGAVIKQEETTMEEDEEL
ncbi:hypothetical protein BFW01_g2490 [Lasiodiplodia theobromae]|uniref:DUF7918 domain-containing protein n=1 Tax=Lasiodiplodia theobromae TaxID=45133 RepID=A0A5N5DQM7_9PEZI|nr:uncharacterized protein LTHEOB_5386 [Lasiodiplodia theobromae]KAB2580047.1 hypothetical protein DBV05_g1355 [Lasiodiplodia theobromae]KAF4544975.1 hypothetical protein LTHEOB_5386 [Lasiodiplodia theobromae]KAF9631628.1 hypothetical protein BFW01_g2490 [Lasiodiplodia theobromae]